ARRAAAAPRGRVRPAAAPRGSVEAARGGRDGGLGRGDLAHRGARRWPRRARPRHDRRHARPAAQVPRRCRAGAWPARRPAARGVGMTERVDPGVDPGLDPGLGLGHDVVGFARALRAAGLSVGVAETEAFAQALSWIDPLARREVYLAARATLVRRREDLAVFDELFAKFFGGPSPGQGQPAPLAPRH